MIVKYKVSDFAKDLSISAKKVLDELNAMGSTGKKNSSTLEERQEPGRVPEQRQGPQG